MPRRTQRGRIYVSAGGRAEWGFGILRDQQVPLAGIFSIFASAALVSVLLVLLFKLRHTEGGSAPLEH